MSALSTSVAMTEEAVAPASSLGAARGATARRMRLTPELVARVAGHIEDPGPMPGRVYARDADYEDAARSILACRQPDGDVWVFAYGSLIWNRPAMSPNSGLRSRTDGTGPFASAGTGDSADRATIRD